MQKYPDKKEQPLQVKEDEVDYKAHQALSDERLHSHMQLSDTEKYKLFRKMMRIGRMLASAKITHQA